MAVDLVHVNKALTRTGNNPVTQLNDGTPGGNIAGTNYVELVKEVLSSYPWRWATKTATLAAISGTPAPPWLYAYQLPADLKHLSAVTVEGQPIEYEQQYNKLLCDVDTSVEVIAKYIWEVPESNWPAEFGEYITQRLEAMFLRGIGERYTEAETRERSAARKLLECKNTDAKRRTARNVVSSPTLQARGGASPAASTLSARGG